MGRLIDEDSLKFTNFEIVMCEGDFKQAFKLLCEKLDNAPTVDVEPKWIPVSERLPEEGVSVLGTFEFQGGRGCRTTERIIINGKEIWSAACGMEPIAWMPLPEPYEEKE